MLNPTSEVSACPSCGNLNVVKEEDLSWCRNCGWTSDGSETPRLARHGYGNRT